MVREPHDRGTDPEADRHRRLLYEAIGIGILVLLAVAFVLKNSQPVEVDLVVATRHPRLIWVILGCLLAGFVVGFWVGGPWRNARRKRR